MVVVLGVFVALLLAVVVGLADVAHPALGVERRHALLGELEVVRAVEEPFSGSASPTTTRPCSRGGLEQDVVEGRLPMPTLTMSRVRPQRLITSMLMSASVFRAGRADARRSTWPRAAPFPRP